MYELIIIGAGPAGITAAIYAARKKIDMLVVTKDIGGLAAITTNIENYTGFQYLTGPELAANFEKHIAQFGVKVKFEEVRGLKKLNGSFEVRTDQDSYQAKSVIIASGSKPRELNVSGEREFKNRGVTYCATCDAPLFADKDVAIVGGGNSGLETVLQLMRIARKIYLVERGPELRGDEVMREKIAASDKVTLLTDAKVLEIRGDNFVTGIEVDVGGSSESLKVEGVFIEIGYVPNTGFASELVKMNELNEIVIDKGCGTSVEGIYAAGDVTDIRDKQIIVAAGDGAKAALCVYKRMQKMRD